MVTDDKITEILIQAPTPKEAIDRLIATANQHGGEDNITALLVFMGES